MRETIGAALARGEYIVCDGAIGTRLQACGIPAGTLSELWNAERPDAVRDVHAGYLAAGSQILTTNTFGGNRARLGEAGLADRLEELNRRGVALAREAADGRAWVGGSLGPTGRMLEPYGDLTVAEAEAIFAEQAGVLIHAGVDLLLVETQQDIDEACAIVRGARAAAQERGRGDLPIFCSFAFDARGRTMMGVRAADAAVRAVEAGADVVGANCGDGPAAVRVALEAMRAATDRPLLAQANAGIPQVGADAATTWDVTPAQLAEHVREFMALGARVVGGCCGTGPAHIRAIVRAVRGGIPDTSRSDAR